MYFIEVMKDENIILFIPMDTSNLDSIPNFNDLQYDPNIMFTDLNPPNFNEFSGINNDIQKSDMDLTNDPRFNQEIGPDPSLTNMNERDLQYNPRIDDIKNAFPIAPNIPQEKDVDYKNVFIQFRECNKRLEWPISTDIHCRHCCHPFNGRPWYLPTDYINGIFIVLPYVFCRPEDVIAWNKDSEHPDWSKRSSLFYLMYKMIHKIKDVTIKSSHKQDMLKIYGGPYDIEDFHDYEKLIKPDYRLEFPEILTVIPKITKLQQKSKNSNGENTYKLQRTKPLMRETKTVFDSIAMAINK